MAKEKFTAPNLANATPEMLIDEMAKLSIAENYAKKMRKVYREALFARLGYDPTKTNSPLEQKGDKFMGAITQSETNRFNTTAFKEAEPTLYANFLKDSIVTTVRFSTIPGITAPGAQKLLEDLYAELGLNDDDE